MKILILVLIAGAIFCLGICFRAGVWSQETEDLAQEIEELVVP